MIKDIKVTKKFIKNFLYEYAKEKYYYLDPFSCFASFFFHIDKYKKIILIEKNEYIFFKNILKKIYKKNFFIIKYDSVKIIKNINILNISFIFFDPPYNFKNIRFLYYNIEKIIFLRKIIYLIIENNDKFIIKFLKYTFFLKKKKKMDL